VIQNTCETSILFSLCTLKGEIHFVIFATFFQDSQYQK